MPACCVAKVGSNFFVMRSVHGHSCQTEQEEESAKMLEEDVEGLRGDLRGGRSR